MDLDLIREGRVRTLYAIRMGDSAVEWLNDLRRSNPTELARMIRRIEQLTDRGPSRRREEFNSLGDGLFEAKTSGGGRMIFFDDDGDIVIATSAFAKKTQKTPKQVIDTARSRRASYLQAKRQGVRFRLFTEDQPDPRRRPK